MAAVLFTCRVQGFSNAGALGTATGMVGEVNLLQVEVMDDNSIRFTDAANVKHTLFLHDREVSKFFKRILSGAAGVPTTKTWSD